ncbi:MAG: serine/threonine-protein kinase, partial [Acidobacteriota bacterium]
MSSDTLPDLIGPYRVTGRLGRGGMGEVLRGYDDRLDRPVALKRVRAAGRDPAKARQRFQREAKIVARLSHPAIVQVYDWEEAEGNDWLVMELIDGRSLEAVLADGPLPPGRAAAIAQQIAAGLAVAHEAGLVHRDLKPANVMVAAGSEGRDEIKILDFGLAKRVELEPPDDSQAATPSTLTEAGQVVGTTASMSPEQTLGWPVDHRSDLFSLGILLYEMLSGVSPFKAEGALHTLNRICSVRETPLRRLDARIPAELADLVGRLLEKEPARRPV